MENMIGDVGDEFVRQAEAETVPSFRSLFYSSC